MLWYRVQQTRKRMVRIRFDGVLAFCRLAFDRCTYTIEMLETLAVYNVIQPVVQILSERHGDPGISLLATTIPQSH